jgi:hypothetical protein
LWISTLSTQSSLNLLGITPNVNVSFCSQSFNPAINKGPDFYLISVLIVLKSSLFIKSRLNKYRAFQKGVYASSLIAIFLIKLIFNVYLSLSTKASRLPYQMCLKGLCNMNSAIPDLYTLILSISQFFIFPYNYERRFLIVYRKPKVNTQFKKTWISIL